MLLEKGKIQGNCLQISGAGTLLHLLRVCCVSTPVFDRNSSYVLLEVGGNDVFRTIFPIMIILHSEFRRDEKVKESHEFPVSR